MAVWQMRALCLLAGYLCGSFLTAAVVVRVKTGGSFRNVGTGNPGMANVMDHLGFVPGALTLLGDILKTVAACALCYHVFFPELGRAAILFAGVGAVVGHNYPVWFRFRGGKGVAVTCTALILFAPIAGTLSDIAGMLVVFATGFLGLGSIVITSVFLAASFLLYDPPIWILAAALEGLMLLRHGDSLGRIKNGTEKKVLKLFGRRSDH